METAVIIARDQKYGRRCQPMFRAAGVFPVVVETVHRALALLGQFRPSVVVLERVVSNGTGGGRICLHRPPPALRCSHTPSCRLLAFSLPFFARHWERRTSASRSTDIG